MTKVSPRAASSPVLGEVDLAVLELEELWGAGEEPSLDHLCDRHGGSVDVLAALIKADLRGRFALGERPESAEYLERFPRLREANPRVVSLIYEEYCLREELGEQIDPEQFCERYEPWRNSLESQLGYHRALSRAMGIPSPSPRFPKIGDRFQGFRLRSILGRGGTARVYLACEEQLGDREVALKVSTNRGHEPSIMGRLKHPNIVPVLSVSFEPETGLRGLCMPYYPGRSLAAVIRSIGPEPSSRDARSLWDAIVEDDAERPPQPGNEGWAGFPIKRSYSEAVAWIVLKLAEALQHAHQQGVHHRDVKPANVILAIREGPLLLDFNLAEDPHVADRAEAALRGGTLPYMAPEQLEAFLDPSRWNDVGAAADLYGLGLLTREFLTGLAPESPDPELPLPRAIRELLDRRADFTSSPRAADPTISHALDAITRKCLAFSTADRYQSASQLVEDLQRFLAHRPLLHAVNPSRSERTRNWLGRNRLCVAPLLLASLAPVAFLRQPAPTIPKEPQTVLREAPTTDQPNSPVQRAELLIRQRRYQQAVVLLDKAIKKEPNQALLHTLRAAALFQSNLLDEADRELKVASGCDGYVEALRQTVAVTPPTARLLLPLGILLMEGKEKNVSEAMVHFQTAASLDPDCFPAHRWIAHIASTVEKDFAKAIEHGTSAIEIVRSRISRSVDNPNETLSDDALSEILGSELMYRGVIYLAWRIDLQERCPDGPLVRWMAGEYYRRAKADLLYARRLLEKSGGAALLRCNFHLAKVELGLGDVESYCDKYGSSVAHYRAALLVLPQANQIPEWSTEIDNLRGIINHHFQTDLPNLLMFVF